MDIFGVDILKLGIFHFAIPMLIIRNLLAHPFLLRVLKYPDTYATSSAASSFVAIIHSVPVCIACYGLMAMHPTTDFGSVSSSFSPSFNAGTLAVTSYTSAYMLQDLFMMIVDELRYKNDEPYFISFLLHHTGVCFYIFSVRYYEVGYYSVLLLIFLGEVTNPLQNVVNVCTQGLKGGKVWPNSILSLVNPIFALFFALARLIVGPIISLMFLYQFLYLHSSSSVPVWCGVLWSALLIATIHGSYPFAIEKLQDGGFIKKEKVA